MRLKSRFILAPVLALMAQPALAQEGFDPSDKCNEILTGASPTTKIMAASWLIGYVDSGIGDRRAVDFAEIERVLTSLAGICQKYPQESLLNVAGAVVKIQMQVDAQAASGGEAGGSENAARAFLEQFMDPGADRVALTKPLIASAEDIRAVYKEPLASRMIEVYREKLPPNIAIAPKPGQTEILLWRTTTDEMKAGSSVLDYFPGGYKRVLDYMNPGFPVVRFKFVEPGADSGRAFDGLIWINDHWAWMPKPWRSLPSE